MGIPIPEDLQDTLVMCAEQREEVCSTHLNTSVEQGHQVVKFATIHLQHSVVVSFDILYRTK
jgi:hypothetical protein